MEASFDFNCHLHNGDPLSERTIEGPAGRPEKGNPPFTWEESAIDALKYDGALEIRNWSLPTIFFFLEKYNGWGYREGKGRATTPPCRSAYIYSGSNHYEKGKYVDNSKFDPDAVSAQVGCMAQLKELENKGMISLPLPSDQKIGAADIGSIAAWQHILNGCGYYPVLEINGEMDQATIAMTKKFQVDLGLQQSGAVDISTWQAGFNHRKIPGWTDLVPDIFNPNRVTGDRSNNVSQITIQLHDYYSQEHNYYKVYDEVMDWYGTTHNACAAFASTALRQSGYVIERIQSHPAPDIWHDTCLITKDLSDYLVEHHWVKYSDASLLQPGDVVFSDDGGYGDGIPEHVYIFSGWHDSDKTCAWVIDNQDFTHIRNIYEGGGGYNFTPFWYFLRS
jgi:Putative peptidoglycan binding domain